MTEHTDPTPAPAPAEPVEAPPTWDREAARARYRTMMRGPFMRGVGILTVVVILLAWAWGAAAAFAPSVDRLPGHDFSVRPQRCVACHRGVDTGALAPGIQPPPLPHPAVPSCGFCHRQSNTAPTKPKP